MSRAPALVLVWLASCLVAVSADPQTPPKPLDPDELVKDLAHDSFAVRDRAAKELWKMGERARPALKKAAAGDDPEAADKAREILGKFDRGIYADTDPEALRIMRDFRGGMLDKQKAAITTLVRMREKGLPTLRILIQEKQSPDVRGYLVEHLANALRREVPVVLFDGKPELAEEMLALNTLGTWTWAAEHNVYQWSPGMLDYTVLVHLRGRGKPVAADLEARTPIDEHVDLATKRALIFVYKAAGEPKKARAVAEKLAAAEPGDPHIQAIVDSLLEDTGAWADLVKRTDNLRVNSLDGLKMFRLRMAGRPKDADAVGDTARDGDDFSGSGFGVDPQTMALLLNGREVDGIDRMREKKNAPHILADVLAARLEFKEALSKVGDGLDKAADPDNELPQSYLATQYAARKGRLLAQLGQREAAVQVFNQTAEKLTVPQTQSQFYQVIRAEVRAGFPDLAAAHLGTFLAATGRQEGAARPMSSGSQNPFEALFDADADAAEYWWATLRAHKPDGEQPAETMKRVRRLLTGKATPADQEMAWKAAAKDTPVGDAAADFVRAAAVGAAYRANGKTEQAIQTLAAAADKFAKAADPAGESEEGGRTFGRGARSWVFGTDERVRLWVDLGDMLSDAGKPAEAAKRYEQGWRRFPDNPVPLYHSGRALVAAGDAKEGRRRIELAHWVALGNARVRGRFLEELLDRGSLAEIRKERDLIRESGWVSELFIGNVWNQVGRASLRLKEFDGAADATRRAIHYLLRTPGISYVEGYAYLTVPQAVRVHTAKGLVAAGKVDEGLALAHDCLKVMPGNVDVPLGMVPLLEKADRKKDADALFRQVWDVYGGLIKEHPDSAWARFSAAWLAAGCKRELDAALAHAQKAHDLDPESKSYREALAEVHFRKGDRDKATALMKALSAGDPRNHHYRKQLERYRTGATDSPLPETDD
jgi:tetratricopeptide (TPR) repeat protein